MSPTSCQTAPPRARRLGIIRDRDSRVNAILANFSESCDNPLPVSESAPGSGWSAREFLSSYRRDRALTPEQAHQTLHAHIERGRYVERQKLREEQATDDRHAQRTARFSARSKPQRD